MLKTSTKLTSLCGIEKYICLFDVVDLQSMKCYQYFAYMTSSRRKNGIWEKTKLDFIPVSNNAPDLQKFFYKFSKNMKNSTLYYGSKEEVDRRITDFPQFCFTYECLNMLLTLFYDFYSFEITMLNACKCGKFLSNACIYTHLTPYSLRSFYFVEVNNSPINGVVYEKMNLQSFVDNISSVM